MGNNKPMMLVKTLAVLLFVVVVTNANSSASLPDEDVVQEFSQALVQEIKPEASLVQAKGHDHCPVSSSCTSDCVRHAGGYARSWCSKLCIKRRAECAKKDPSHEVRKGQGPRNIRQAQGPRKVRQAQGTRTVAPPSRNSPNS